ncbi:oxidoreductase [Clostridium perfringens]|uniref:C-GCAxxG-C-C family protein n=1 Tax=Clostridium perfringens TaxID=1502 RepID=UPI0013E33A13|nr:C-GCAxxG-C-C family protein [Clostridium perfringens]EJT6493060.1 C-GCAxxG-C-C family protein [Clostridium perfringens]MBI6035600.1 C-GCAxxG-C-C family protein [Clostridium perfringens]MDJ8948604.1 C-GCAxxG-C-C family protein [Clostridium perfringens]MDJ9040519.1 C-GCAxxG-C-C family protein [Clostridium perfringens]MDJ9048730.1 C-GCAxxG-C-C family protein [Clostridium perfringens]
MKSPSEYHKEGYTCAEAIIKSYNEEFNKDIPVSLGSGMGTGMAVGSLCGAVNGAVVAIGFIKGRESNDEKNEARAYSKELLNRIREEFNSEICLDLKKSKVSCAEIIDFAYDTLKYVLKEK